MFSADRPGTQTQHSTATNSYTWAGVDQSSDECVATPQPCAACFGHELLAEAAESTQTQAVLV